VGAPGIPLSRFSPKPEIYEIIFYLLAMHTPAHLISVKSSVNLIKRIDSLLGDKP